MTRHNWYSQNEQSCESVMHVECFEMCDDDAISSTLHAKSRNHPGCGSKKAGSVHVSYANLMALMEQGWRIEPPVYIRPRWRPRLCSYKENTYHFILWHGNRSNLVSVLDCPQIQQFLAVNDLTIESL